MLGKESDVLAYRFGSFELDNRSGDLRKQGVRLKLQDQPRRILLLLLQSSGEVVSREGIQRSLWPDNTFIDYNNAINTAVRKLREVLGDTADNPRFVETVARRGYRFLAEVSVINQAAVIQVVPEPGPRPASVASPIPAPVARQHNWKLVVAAGVTLAGVTLAIAATVAAEFNRIGVREASSNIRVVPLTANAGREYSPSFSPDGTRVAYIWNAPETVGTSVYVKSIGAGDPVRITEKASRYYSPAWSPDGRFIAALRSLDCRLAIVLVPAFGGRERELTSILRGTKATGSCSSTHPAGNSPRAFDVPYGGSLLAWSPDAKYLFVSDSIQPDSPFTIVRVSVESGERTALTMPPAGIAGDLGPAVSPSGRELAFVRLRGVKTGDIYVLPLSAEALPGDEAKRITFDGADTENPVWARDGHELIFSSDFAGRHELWRMQASSKEKPFRVAGFGENAVDLAVSPNGGRLVYSRGFSSGSLWKIALEAGENATPVSVTATTASDGDSHYSNDGKRIAFQSGRSGVDEIWVCDADGSNAVQLTNFRKGMSGSPRWSPDDKTIVFDSNVGGDWEIYSIPAQGGRAVPVTAVHANNTAPEWSRDGQWIYFASSRSGRGEIWRARPNGGSEKQMTASGASAASESPDGKYLYFKHGNEDGAGIWKMPLPDGPAVQVVAASSGRFFEVTRKGIYFAARFPRPEMRYLDFSSGIASSLAAGNFGRADVSPDERWILYPKSGGAESSLMLAENFR